ncbi:MAG: hypothetical protein NTZ92_05865 [Candidatus Omnitrophica bacterium]|nr:hypothetical protein [Candidatus Omnitrophota bacterium]
MFTRKGQSILEYSILLAVVIAVLLIMQAFVKRGYQGSLKASADKMGEQFSASSTTIKEKQEMKGDQDVITEVGTTGDVMGQFSSVIPTGVTIKGTLDQAEPAYSLNTRTGGIIASTTESKTASAQQEKARLEDYKDDSVTDFTDPDLPQ